MTVNSNCFWRIGISETTLESGRFANLNLPYPSVSTFQDYRAVRTRGDGSASLHGRSSVTLLFDILTSEQGWTVRHIVEQSLAATGRVFLTIPRADGAKPGYDWIDVSGVPHRPTVSGAGSYNGRSGDVYFQNYQLTVDDVQILNDPSDFVF